MEISLRLKEIANMVDRCESIVDVGTDHAYIPIYLIKNNICKNAIAGDINKGPLFRAQNNIAFHNLQGKIQCRLGPGLTKIYPKEVNGAIIAGMGGHLIKDILEESKEVFKTLDFLVLQPVQNPEALRKHIYNNGYKILEESLVFEDNRFYEIIKIRYDKNVKSIDPIYYEIGQYLINNRHPLITKFLCNNIDKYKKILQYIKEDTDSSKLRKVEIKKKIFKLEELLNEFKC
ncbi:class I SAM-dependent methyltransferase [Clostridium sp. Marseille-Q2269]|uniref:tRNA (adenine(22)-N(1))-methyltransferase n=1 Tax=Clostridium sp. Marseille-Q2269 TaxID=2942205 RepID=UPI0020739B53|nr:class I SAM-dependent methyltransferase [Clostridium sp. Marseille-Q2269]